MVVRGCLQAGNKSHSLLSTSGQEKESEEMQIDDAIIPGESVGGISLKSNLEEIANLAQLVGESHNRSNFVSSERQFQALSIKSFGISFVADADGQLVRITCELPYSGAFAEVFRPGMTVSEVSANASSVLPIHGLLVVDGQFGLGLDYPEVYQGSSYDDIDDIDDLPGEMQITALHVLHENWWR